MRRAIAAAAACALLVPAAASATAPAERFNAPGQRHVNLCVSLAAPLAPLRYTDGSPTGFTLSDQLGFENDNCAFGQVRVDFREIVPSPDGPLLFHRGGHGYFDAPNVKYGYLTGGELAGTLPQPVPSSGGRGAACELTREPAYTVDIRQIPSIMKYKRPQDIPSGSNSGASFMHYGDPASGQGDRHDIHYSYLAWSFVNVRGGGMVRALLKQGQVVRTCDVEPITMLSWDKKGEVNGHVTARYVRIHAGNDCPLYGWMAWSHDYHRDPEGTVTHAVPRAEPPGPDPVPGRGCPVSAPGKAPSVTTGDAAPDGDGSARLAGAVDTVGATGAFWFEYGRDRNYGAATPMAEAVAADTDVAVAAYAPGLDAGTTYHYRLVAATVHGVTRGPDREFTTAGSPPRARVAEPAPVLSGLRVAPRAFRSSAQIRFALSRPATVSFAFERRARGSRRWVRVGGSLVRRAAGGRSVVRFRGRLDRRRLARGSYRIRALPTGVTGLRGTARRASFRIR